MKILRVDCRRILPSDSYAKSSRNVRFSSSEKVEVTYKISFLTGLAAVLLLGYQVSFAQELTGQLRICELSGLTQLERQGAEVSLAVATTGWNVGSLPLNWYKRPDARHPFITQALYRIREGRFEQIGISGVKHGYYVAANQGCDGQPCQGANGQILDSNCTDTYGATLNGSQIDMGPRYEVNPWTGGWIFATSHFAVPHTHDGVQQRLRVLDSDLDKASNDSAEYFIEAYYVHYQNLEPSTAAAWRKARVGGEPQAEWSFDLGDLAQPPKPGFAISSAWQGAMISEIAQVRPVVRGMSPDGRCLLASKVRDLGNGKWRYEYALMNIDMDRQVRAFSVPISSEIEVSDRYFSAPRQPDERLSSVSGPVTDDSPWISDRGQGRLTWGTTTNPLRWGVMYNFGFTANRAPTDGELNLSLFKPGEPSIVTGRTNVPTP